VTSVGFEKSVFFDLVRQSLFGGHLSQSQVNGINYVLREWRRRYRLAGDHRWLAYMLATDYHETAYTMLPITEYGSQEYLQSKEYWPYIGRGLVQLTWEDNYRRAGDILDEDLLEYPDLALHPDIATEVMFEGMRDGWFTELKLSDYFNDHTDDPVNARKIINGTDRAETIADYHDQFLTAINAALIPA
jgi:predicted chitinase